MLNWFRRAPEPEAKSLAAPTWQDFALFGAVPSAAGVTVTAETAMRCTAVRQATLLISGSIAALPIRCSRLRDGGIREELSPSDYRPAAVLRRPNSFTGGVAFWRDLISDYVLTGNGFAIATRVGGNVRELIRVPPETVSIDRDLRSLEPRYRVTLADGESRLYPAKDVLHLRGLPAADGLRGRGLVQDAREAIGLALLLESHAAFLMRNGGKPSGVLKSPGRLGEEAKARLARAWRSATGGENVGNTPMLEEGVTFEPVTMNNVDSELIALRRFAIGEIARAANLSPLLLGDLEKSTFSNAEAAALNLLVLTLTPIIEALEDELERVLLPTADRDSVSIDFDYTGFAVADLEKRTSAAAKEIEIGAATVNEIRARLGRSPVQGGDAPMTSVQSRPLGTAPQSATPTPAE